MKNEHIKELSDFINLGYPESIDSGFKFFLGEEIKRSLLKNVFCYNIENMYTTILSMLHENNLINLPQNKDIKFFLENKRYLKENNKPEYERLKILSNSLYAKFNFDVDKKSYNKILLKYVDIFYKDLIKSYKDDILFINVDYLITKKDINFDIPFKYEKSKFDYFYIINDFHFIWLENGKMKTNNKAKILDLRYEEFYKKFRLSIREDKLKQLLHEKINI